MEGAPRQRHSPSAWAALLLLGGATAVGGGFAASVTDGDVAPVLAAAAAAVAAGAVLLHRVARASSRAAQDHGRERDELRLELERARAELESVAAEAERLRAELGAQRKSHESALTGRREREERILQAERLASVGTLAGGVAHEVNNPLAYVAANLDYVDQQIDALLAGELPFTTAVAEEMRVAIADARGGILRVRDVVRGMRSFAKAARDRKRPGDPKRELETALSLASNEIKHRARLTARIEEMPPVDDAEHELTQVFVNLLVNAAQSIPEGRAQDNEIRVDARLDTSSGCIRVEISDTGSGIPARDLPRIFDPFFTTRAVGIGVGLGLSVCHGIVRSLGGEIQVESTPGKGSTFRVVLPAGRRGSSRPAALRATEVTPRRSVLVVDDDAMVGRSLQRILEPEHTVTYVTSARDALDRLGMGERFDVVLCDLMMPDLSGMEFDREVSVRFPEASAGLAFMTGGAFTEGAREFLARTSRPVVEKPIDVAALRALVAAMPARLQAASSS